MNTIKLYKGLFLMLVLAALLLSCEDNPVGPSYKKVGSATATNAFITVSTTTPASEADMTVTLKYVNITSDPAIKLVLLVREGAAGAFTEVTSFNESGQPLKAEITRTHTYNVTQTAGTQLTFRLELHTQVEFPKLVNSPVVTVQ